MEFVDAFGFEIGEPGQSQTRVLSKHIGAGSLALLLVGPGRSKSITLSRPLTMTVENGKVFFSGLPDSQYLVWHPGERWTFCVRDDTPVPWGEKDPFPTIGFTYQKGWSKFTLTFDPGAEGLDGTVATARYVSE